MNQIDLTGRAAIVTGAARGIGYAIAERLLASGAKCSLWDRDAAALDAAAAVLAAKGEVHTVCRRRDRRGQACEPPPATTVERFGAIDILVNNAGIAGGSKPSWEFTPEECGGRSWTCDLTGVFLCCRAVVPRMLPRPGRIVNVASIAGKEGNPNAAHYTPPRPG